MKKKHTSINNYILEKISSEKSLDYKEVTKILYISKIKEGHIKMSKEHITCATATPSESRLAPGGFLSEEVPHYRKKRTLCYSDVCYINHLSVFTNAGPS